MVQNLSNFTNKFSPSDLYQDPTNKLRVTTPQSLIDTDFEYGTQITKWENLSLINNIPSFYASPTPLTITAVTMASASRTVTVATTTPPVVGTPVYVQDSYLQIANGNFVVETVSAGVSFTYTAEAVNTSSITDLFDSNKTAVYSGTKYTGSSIGAAPTITVSGTDYKVTVTTTIPHNLSIGNEIIISGITGTNPPNGNFAVATINSPTQFVYYAHPSTGIPSGLTVTSSSVSIRPQSQFLHRAFDGGVLFSTNSSSNNISAIRQTRRYFRYQSGKGIQVSSGTILKPSLSIDSITSSGTTVTVLTKESHNLQVGNQIVVSGCNESAYNGTFTVVGCISPSKFTYTASSTPSASTASGTYNVSVPSWYGSSNRLGMFDSQNGVFWEYDGQTLYVVRRSATFQISGRISATNGSCTVTQSSAEFPTVFSKQLTIGDSLVLRGQTYLITAIASDTSMTISPAYRGTSGNFIIGTKVVETRIPQSQFNIDKLDGTGSSGYNVDLSKMQMFYIDYTWYGAGFIRWGMRAVDGNIIYAHKMQNNNVNTEAYMRSGNLPARYETVTKPAITTINANIGASDTSITVLDTSSFPSSGTLAIKDGTKYEYVNYTGKTATTFTGLTRAQAGTAVSGISTTWTAGSATGTVSSATGLQIGQRVYSTTSPSPIQNATYISAISGTTVTLSQAPTAANPNMIFAPMGSTSGQSFTYSATAPVSVEFAWPTFAPSISHWGTSVIMDGRFDDDKSLIFTYGQTTFSTIAAGASKALFSIRLAPSVDSGTIGAFGVREIINRMQLKLNTLDILTKTSGASMLIRAYLNCTPSAATSWTNAVANATGVTNSSLAQIADHGTGAVTVSGGELTGGFFATGTGSISLDSLRDLGNSILGGGGSAANTQIYPDGPDTLTIVVTNLGAASVDVLGKISWTEAQA